MMRRKVTLRKLRSTQFIISEILVDLSKQHITQDDAIEKIHTCLKDNHVSYKDYDKLEENLNNTIKEAFKIVSEFISEHHPFSEANNRWDKDNGSIKFISGFRCLEEYIKTIAEEGVNNDK